MSTSAELKKETMSEDGYSMSDIWIRGVSQPAPATYEDLLDKEPNPTLDKAMEWMAVAGLITGTIVGFLAMVSGIAQGQPLAPLVGGWVLTVFVVPVVLIIALLIVSAIWLAIAKALGGQGDIDSQSYFLAAVGAPMSIISAVLATTPVAGQVLSTLAALYGL